MFMDKCLYTDSEKETAGIAEKLAGGIGPGCFIALNGDLGAGKTAFVKGLAKGLGIKEPIVSPTFTLLRVYESGRLPMYHFDIYRLGGGAGLEDIDFYDYAEGDGVCVCEWAGLAEDELPPDRLDINIERLPEDGRRKLTFICRGNMQEVLF